MRWYIVSFYCYALLQASCAHLAKPSATAFDTTALKPVVVTEKVYEDSDDPAIWISQENKAKSLIIGTDKHKDQGGLFVFDLQGKIDSTRSVTGMKRVNNVDV